METLVRCIIVEGTYAGDDESADAFATVETHDGTKTTFLIQSWPGGDNRIKIVAMLSPGRDVLTIARSSGTGKIVRELDLTCVLLLQAPPLHLASAECLLDAQTPGASSSTRTAYSRSDGREGLSVVDDDTTNDARRDLQDSLSFQSLDHFWLPGDARFSAAARSSAPAIVAVNIGTDDAGLEALCAARVARIDCNGEVEPQPCVASPSEKGLSQPPVSRGPVLSGGGPQARTRSRECFPLPPEE
ncbi:zinc metalloproteinase [Colletotrichum graminicola]|nr:zinc metalloproteinase [Colletotrichum graminicola]